MHPPPILSVLLHVAAVAAAETYPAETGCDPVPQDFAQPPMTSRALFRYWLPDASVSADIVRRDILNITATGAGGVEFLPFYLYGLPSGGVPPTDWAEYGFGSPAFREVFQAAVEATDDAKGTFDFSAANQGQGVPAPANSRGLAMQLLLGKASLKAGQTFDGAVPPPQRIPDILSTGLGFQHHLESFGPRKLVATIAIEITAFELGGNTTLPSYKVNVDSIEDLTDTVTEGRLTWTAPASNTTWQVLSFYEAFTNQKSCAGVPNTTTVIGNGSWTLDHFSEDGAALLTDFFDKEVFPDEGTRQRLSLLNGNVWEDSMEMLATLWWTPGFLSSFESRLGYSLVKYLPFLYIADNQWGQFFPTYLETYVDDSQPTDAISKYVLDYRRILNEGYQAYIQHVADWAHLRGFKYSHQPAYNLPLDMSSDIPFLDTPETESLGFQDDVDSYRAFSGPANLAGAQQISVELGAVRTFPYTLTVPNLLWAAKRAFAGGCNRMVFHGFPYSGNYVNTTWPGYVTFNFGFTEMWNNMQPCWAHFKGLLDFIGRTQHILQSGVAKVDIAFYHFEAPFTIGAKYNSRNLLELGYTYDFLGPENLRLPLATVEDRILAPTGPGYKALIFNNQTTLPDSTISTLSMFANAGFYIFFVTQVPIGASATVRAQQKQNDQTLSKMLLSLPNVQFLASVDDLPQALSRAGILPRVQLECGESAVYTAWRHTKERDYLYLYNDRTQPIDCAANITTPENTIPYIVDAWTGRSQRLFEYTRLSAKSLQIPLRLAGNATQMLSLVASPQASMTNSITATSGEVRSFHSKHGSTIIAAVAGSAEITTSDGRKLSLDESVPRSTSLDIWDIEIQDWHGPTNPAQRFEVLTEIDTTRLKRKRLAVWSSYGEQYRNISGIGIYTTKFTTPEVSESVTSSPKKLGAFLKLPLVKHTLRVRFNSKELPPVDPLTPVVDLSAHIAPPGRSNTITIEVATTLFNRILSEIDSLQFIGVPLSKVEPALINATRFEYGLVGPVEVEWASLFEFEL